MTEASFEGQAQIEIGVAAAEFPAAPGSTTTIPILLSNRGTGEDVVTLAVDGVPAEWVTTPPRLYLAGPREAAASRTHHPATPLPPEPGRQAESTAPQEPAPEESAETQAEEDGAP
jgi:hypothetical protein